MKSFVTLALLASTSALQLSHKHKEQQDLPADSMLVQEWPVSGSGLAQNKQICNGFNSGNCIEPRDLVQIEDDSVSICTGFNDGRCIEPKELVALRDDSTGDVIQICNGTNTGRCIEANQLS